MTPLLYVTAALTAAVVLSGGQALANTCQTAKLMCRTTMPVDGYCECRAHGTTEGGTVVPTPPNQRTNATSGGCGVNPGAPGCR